MFFHQILGVAESASSKEIETAYQAAMARKPDIEQQLELSMAKTILLEQATVAVRNQVAAPRPSFERFLTHEHRESGSMPDIDFDHGSQAKSFSVQHHHHYEQIPANTGTNSMLLQSFAWFIMAGLTVVIAFFLAMMRV